METQFNERVGDEAVYLRLKRLTDGTAQFTDSSNGLRLMKTYGDDIRYLSAWKKWLVWNGKCWQTDDGFLIQDLALKVIRGIFNDVLNTNDYRERLDIEKFAIQSESMRRRKAMVEAAAHIPQFNITANDVDRNPFLFNVQNGTIDLKSGEFREHRREDMISKIASVAYNAGADCPMWKQFIREIMNYKTDLIMFLQKAAGWALTGDTSEQTMFILYGTGANGKSTFLNTVMKILGNYAIAASTDTFMKRTNAMSNDIARLRGARFVSTAEAEMGRRFSEPLIKQITGNDTLTARFLYGEYFDWTRGFYTRAI